MRPLVFLQLLLNILPREEGVFIWMIFFVDEHVNTIQHVCKILNNNGLQVNISLNNY